MEDRTQALHSELLTLNRRIGVMISLMLRTMRQEGAGLSLREQVGILSDLGVRPREIAEILGRTPTYINKELSGLRKTKGKTDGKKKRIA